MTATPGSLIPQQPHGFCTCDTTLCASCTMLARRQDTFTPWITAIGGFRRSLKLGTTVVKQCLLNITLNIKTECDADCRASIIYPLRILFMMPCSGLAKPSVPSIRPTLLHSSVTDCNLGPCSLVCQLTVTTEQLKQYVFKSVSTAG